MVVLNLVGAPLNTPAAPLGIVSFELAGSSQRAQEILGSWDVHAQLRAAFSLGLDYVFMLAYSATIGLACIWAGEALQAYGWPLAGLGRLLAWSQWLAALLDGLENIALVAVLFGRVFAPWPQLAQWSAAAKFALVFAGMIYVYLGLAVRLTRRIVPEPPGAD